MKNRSKKSNTRVPAKLPLPRLHLIETSAPIESPASEAQSASTSAAEVAVVGSAGAVSASVAVAQVDITGNVDPNDPEEMAKFKYSLEYVESIGPMYIEQL